MTIQTNLLLAAALLSAAGVDSAAAQTYPTKPLRMVLPTTPGGGADTSARLLAQKMSEYLGQAVVVENRPGAGGAIADDTVAKSAPDGYTLLYAAGSSAILPALRNNLPYSLERDLAPVSLAVVTAFVLSVHPSVPVRDVKSFIALARKQPGQLKFGSPGLGTSAHFAGEIANMMANVHTLHVPFRGPAEAAIALVSGEVDLAYPAMTGALPFIRLNKIRGLGVTSPARSPLLPELPTLSEAGIAGYERAGWNGVLVPSATPRDVVMRLNGVIVKAGSQPAVREGLTKQGFETRTSTPEEFGAFIKRELAQNAKVVKYAGLKVE